MNRNITERNAVAAIMDSVFQQIDERWDQIWQPVERILDQLPVRKPKSNFVKFNYSLAALAINMRATFDIFPQHQAERMFTTMQALLEKQLGEGKGFHAVTNTIVKFTEAYNNGIIKIDNPVNEVAMLLYYKIGLGNTEQQVVDEKYYVPEPKIVDYLSRSLTIFTGKWEALVQKYQVVPPA